MPSEPTVFLTAASIRVLNQLGRLALMLDKSQYCKNLELLSHGTIGKHYRHIIEFFQCLQHAGSTVDYDARGRNAGLENDNLLASQAIEGLIELLKNTHEDKALSYTTDFSGTGNEAITAPTSYLRELSYNIEHAVHHMAIIQMVIKHYYPAIVLEKDFGVAASTLRYRQIECAQ
jgi:hypothetical protein